VEVWVERMLFLGRAQALACKEALKNQIFMSNDEDSSCDRADG